LRTSGKKVDRGEIDVLGVETPCQQYYRDYAARAKAEDDNQLELLVIKESRLSGWNEARFGFSAV
jgi:hypothetical protein